MPPVTKAGGDQFRKDVEFVAKDAEEQIAAGIVMVPDKADLQHDFAREGTIRSFADQFATFVEADEASGGLMHAAWPDEWLSLERNEVLDEAEELGGQTVEAGAWVQAWQFNDDDAWALVADGILDGFSIGAIQVDWNGPFEQDDDAVDDIGVAEALDDDALLWELTDGIIREVSAVDIPAVPDAEILDTKADAQKRLAEHLGNEEAFIEEAVERGHSEAEAERLWTVLNDAMSVDGAGDPGKGSVFARAGKAFLSALTPGSDDDALSEAPDRTAATAGAGPRGAAKEGRTLSTANRDAIMAQIDAGLDVLHDAGVEDLPKRFTDREDVDFDLGEHEARSWPGAHDDGDEDDEPDDDDGSEASAPNDATGGDTPDDDTTMSDDTPDDDPMADAPPWAKALDDRIDSLETDKNADPDADDDPMADAPEWAKDLAGRVDEIEEKALGDGDADNDGEEDIPEWAKDLADRVDTIARQSGYSDQIDAASGDGGDEESGLDDIGKALS